MNINTNKKLNDKEINQNSSDNLAKSLGYLANMTRKDVEKSLSYFDLTSKSNINKEATT